MASLLQPLRILLVGAPAASPWSTVFEALGWVSETAAYEAWFASPGSGWDAALLDASGPRSPDLWLRIHQMVPRVAYPLLLASDGPVPASFHIPRAGGLRVALVNPGATPDVVRSTVGLARQLFRSLRLEDAGGVQAGEADRTAALQDAVRRAQRDLEALQAVLAPAPRGREAALGDREAQVLDWLMRGVSAAGIAQGLGIAESTVKKHMNAIYRKKGVTGRAQLMARGD